MLKVNHKNTRTMASFWYFWCWFWTYFKLFSSVSFVDFEQVNVCWVWVQKFWTFQGFLKIYHGTKEIDLPSNDVYSPEHFNKHQDSRCNICTKTTKKDKAIRCFIWVIICDVLRDLLAFAQFKKCEKTPMEECYF